MASGMGKKPVFGFLAYFSEFSKAALRAADQNHPHVALLSFAPTDGSLPCPSVTCRRAQPVLFAN